MRLKLGRNKYNLTIDDRILGDGIHYQLITRQNWNGHYFYRPIISKVKMRKLIREGKLILAPDACGSSSDGTLTIYSLYMINKNNKHNKHFKSILEIIDKYNRI